MDDRQIVEGVRLADRDAVAELYDRYADVLHDYARRRTHSGADAADIVHDAFLVAVERIHQLRDPDRLRPWLYAITRTELHRRYRDTARYTVLDADEWREPVSREPGPEELAQRRELVELLREASEGLADDDRELLDLHLRHGLVGAGLAAAAGLPAKHASVALDRVKGRLTRTIGVVLLARAPVCTEFAAMLASQDGMSPLARKRLARHVDNCELCHREQARRLRPEVLLAAPPMLAAPRELRARLLSSLQARRPAPGGQVWDRHGFPWPALERARRWPAAVLAAAVLLLIGGTFLVARPWLPDRAVAVEPVTPTRGPTSPAVPGALLTGATSTSTTPTATTTATSTTTTTRRTTTTTPPRTTTATPARDATPPTIGPVSISPDAFSTAYKGTATCTQGPMTTRAVVLVTVTDPAGIEAVTMSWSGPAGTSGRATMRSGANGIYIAAAGPAAVDAANPAPQPGAYGLAVSVQAVDAAGNRGEQKTTFARAVVHCRIQ